jgi:hypothetical protein
MMPHKVTNKNRRKGSPRLELNSGHEGRKVLVRYEDLRADTLGTMRRIYSALEIAVEEGQLAGAVNKNALESMPNDRKGPGIIRHRGTSGGWREDLTPEQAKIVERITAPTLRSFTGSSSGPLLLRTPLP